MVYLEIILKIDLQNRHKVSQIYQKFKKPFLTTILGAQTKELLLREQDIQVLHRFDSLTNATLYLESDLFKKDVVQALTPLLETTPDIRIYQSALESSEKEM